PATRGLHRVAWSFRGDAEQLPLSPSERRDSVATDRRLTQVADSLVEAGRDRAEVDSVVTELRNAEQGGGDDDDDDDDDDAPAGEFVERPAEGEPPDEPEGGEEGAEEGEEEESLRQTITRLVRGDTVGRGGRGRRGGGSLFPRRTDGPAPIAEPGTYTVTLRIGDEVLTEMLEVRRAPTAPTM
ncbi:MAG: hypothetical protein ACREIV_15945, partial [Planctomycetaceae bacterium]